ncbi:zinc metalloprotease [Nostocoides australiense]|uniref:Peptidase M10 metallopeptidase domain-containing protein n=1 Tax=Nostocoides australiense Ben110 TaxID=1193182 RepID=W6JTL6_9MICO|nr:hypothetical protein [Tetrasphaera australiensis]CCH71816.1 exported hypothetical protein [Tetrasphaera australiensis Ben110]
MGRIPAQPKIVAHHGGLRVALGLLAATACGLPATAASANNFGSACDSATPGFPGTCVSLANNTSHAIKRVGMYDTSAALDDVPGMATAISRFTDFKYSDTVTNMFITTTDPQPDVVASDDYYPHYPDVAGWVNCASGNTGTGGSHPNRWCRGQHLRINSYSYWNRSDVLDNVNQRRRVACHELGHTIGLRHKPTDPAEIPTFPLAESNLTCMFYNVHDS